MQQYLYPQNLKAEVGMWLWSMRDFSVVAISALVSALVFAATKSVIPLAVAGVYGFLTIRIEDLCVLDFLSWATRYFISTQQEFRWRMRLERHYNNLSGRFDASKTKEGLV